MSEHRVPMLGASWRRAEDPALSRDPRVRAVVGALATLPSPDPSDVFRAELRAQLVAIAPRIVAESATTAAPPRTTSTARVAGGPKHADGVFARLRGISLGRPLAVAASVITVFALLLGGAVWMSQKALPGDTLYGLKRASESFQLSLDSNPTDKAKDYLKFAQTRVDEASGLASRATADALGSGAQAGVIDSHTADLIASTLGSADSDVKDATTLLTKQAVSSKSSSPLKIITDWAPSQIARLQSLAAAVPDGSLRDRAQSSARLVHAALTRAQALAPAVANGCASTTSVDSLGALPGGCGTGTSSVAPAPGTKTGHARHSGGSNVGPNSGPVIAPVTRPNSPSGGTGGSSSGSQSPGLPLPTVPLPTKSLPVSVSTCSVGVTLGPIGLDLGSCSSP